MRKLAADTLSDTASTALVNFYGGLVPKARARKGQKETATTASAPPRGCMFGVASLKVA